jgi:hypothetical protein
MTRHPPHPSDTKENAMRWNIEVQYRAEVEPSQLELLAKGAGVVMAHHNSAERALRLRTVVTVSSPKEATDLAWRFATAAETLMEAVGVAGELQRFSVESEAAAPLRWAAGAAEAADLLGVSTARLRQIEQSDPAFPRPVAELAGGRVYRADEVESYRRGRVLSKGGRPRKEP